MDSGRFFHTLKSTQNDQTFISDPKYISGICFKLLQDSDEASIIFITFPNQTLHCNSFQQSHDLKYDSSPCYNMMFINQTGWN